MQQRACNYIFIFSRCIAVLVSFFKSLRESLTTQLDDVDVYMIPLFSGLNSTSNKKGLKYSVY